MQSTRGCRRVFSSPRERRRSSKRECGCYSSSCGKTKRRNVRLMMMYCFVSEIGNERGFVVCSIKGCECYGIELGTYITSYITCYMLGYINATCSATLQRHVGYLLHCWLHGRLHCLLHYWRHYWLHVDKQKRVVLQ